jgi:hypothetical protein
MFRKCTYSLACCDGFYLFLRNYVNRLWDTYDSSKDFIGCQEKIRQNVSVKCGFFKSFSQIFQELQVLG